MTERKDIFNTEILVKYFKGESNKDENTLITSWIEESKENEKLFLELRVLWEAGKLNDVSIKEIIVTEWKKLESRIDAHDYKKHFSHRSPDRVRNLIYNALKIAAIFIVSLGISWYLLNNTSISGGSQNISYYEFRTPKGSKSVIDLPDGSKVYLNAESYLRFPEKFTKSNREIYLEGEAYFDITKNTENPLIVKTSEINIKVVGTAFNVKSYPDEGTIETTLVRGEIILEKSKTDASEKASTIKLEPNQRATFIKKQGNIHLDNVDPVETIESKTNQLVRKEKLLLSDVQETEKYTAWKDGKLIFDNETFENLAIKLERWYDIKITINDEELKQIRFTGTFENETIEQGLEIMQLTTPISYTMDKNELLIKMKK